jgi:hypothetical protein
VVVVGAAVVAVVVAEAAVGLAESPPHPLASRVSRVRVASRMAERPVLDGIGHLQRCIAARFAATGVERYTSPCRSGSAVAPAAATHLCVARAWRAHGGRMGRFELQCGPLLRTR